MAQAEAFGRMQPRLEIQINSGIISGQHERAGDRHQIVKPGQFFSRIHVEDIGQVLEAVDDGDLPPFLPGQYLTFKAPPDADGKARTRCYSLSDIGDGRRYRISVKSNADQTTVAVLNASGQPETGSRPVQLGTAVSRNPAMIAPR